MIEKVTIEFTSEYQLNSGTWFVPGSKLVMKANVADWYLRRGLAKLVSKPRRKASKNDDSVDTDKD